jgi:BlaI family transcriptional regulator, penicillinase repressor
MAIIPQKSPPKLPQISDAEWEVMKALWDKGPMRSGELVRVVSVENSWHARTIKTLLMRLVRKGAVSTSLEGKRHVYRARVAREACLKKESRSFISRVFDGAFTPALVHMIRQAKLSQQEIDQLKQVLEEEGQ